MVAVDQGEGVLTWRAEDVGIQVPPSQPAGHLLLLVPREPTGRNPARAGRLAALYCTFGSICRQVLDSVARSTWGSNSNC